MCSGTRIVATAALSLVGCGQVATSTSGTLPPDARGDGGRDASIDALRSVDATHDVEAGVTDDARRDAMLEAAPDAADTGPPVVLLYGFGLGVMDDNYFCRPTTTISAGWPPS
jgi:hypothetical protein